MAGILTRALRATLFSGTGTEVGTAAAPLRTDPTGTTTQPVSGSVTATGPLTDTQLRATAVPVSGTVTANAGTGPFPVSDNAGSLTVDAPVGTPAFARLSDGTTALTTPNGSLNQNLARVADTAVSTGSGVLGAGTQRVVLATDQPIVSVQGGAASDAAVSGNVVRGGGRANTSAPTAVSADGDAVDLWVSRTGALHINIVKLPGMAGHAVNNTTWSMTSSVTGAATGSATRTIAAGTSGTILGFSAVYLAGAATAGTLNIRIRANTGAGTIRWESFLGVSATLGIGSGMTIAGPLEFQMPDGEDVYIECVGSAASHIGTFSVHGFDALL